MRLPPPPLPRLWPLKDVTTVCCWRRRRCYCATLLLLLLHHSAATAAAGTVPAAAPPPWFMTPSPWWWLLMSLVPVRVTYTLMTATALPSLRVHTCTGGEGAGGVVLLCRVFIVCFLCWERGQAMHLCWREGGWG